METATQALSEPQVIPLDQLSRRIERAVSRLQPSDKRPRLVHRLKSGPDYPLDPRAAELTRDEAITFTLQVMMSLEPDELCTADRTKAATCRPDTCAPCRDHMAGYAALTELVAHELDELEAELSGLAETEPVSPDPAKWYVHCQDCGQRFLTSSPLARYCTDACRKRSSRAAGARTEAARLSREQSPGVRTAPGKA
jgi:hypothetical protein